MSHWELHSVRQCKASSIGIHLSHGCCCSTTRGRWVSALLSVSVYAWSEGSGCLKVSKWVSCETWQGGHFKGPGPLHLIVPGVPTEVAPLSLPPTPHHRSTCAAPRASSPSSRAWLRAPSWETTTRGLGGLTVSSPQALSRLGQRWVGACLCRYPPPHTTPQLP